MCVVAPAAAAGVVAVVVVAVVVVVVAVHPWPADPVTASLPVASR